MKILIVEDDLEISKLLADFLQGNGYEVLCQYDGLHVLYCIQEHQIDLILLDIMLPYRSGDTILADIRKFSTVPVIVISAKETTQNKIDLLRLGADDYIEKPYDIDIMLAKIGGIFKRRYAVSELTDGNIRINKISRTVYKNGTLVEMTSKEFNLLVLLMENKGKALSKEYIFNQIWGSDSFSEQQTLTVHIKWLRQKIEDDPKNPKKILTVWGVGYKYESV